MMKNKFELLAQCSLTPEEYERIETVYMHHPLMGSDSEAKAKIVEFYKAGLIPDLYPRAEEIKKLESRCLDLHNIDRSDRVARDLKIKEAEDEYSKSEKLYMDGIRAAKIRIAELQEVRI